MYVLYAYTGDVVQAQTLLGWLSSLPHIFRSKDVAHLMVELNPQTHLRKKQKHPTISPCCVICYNRFLIQNARRNWTNSSKLEFCQCNTNDIQLYFIVKCHSSPCFPTMPLISENQAGAMVSGEDFPQTNPLNLVFVASRILTVESPFFVS